MVRIVPTKQWTRSISHFLQVWEAFEGEHLFTGRDPEHGTYRGRAHLSEKIALLEPPPPSLLSRANTGSSATPEMSYIS